MIFYFMFMIPLIFLLNSLHFYQFILIISMLLFLSNNFFDFFGSLFYVFGNDFYSFFLIFLCLLISCFMLMSVFSLINLNFFIFMIFFLCFILILVFSCLNLFIFYIFFEFSLIPLILLIFGWGYQPERLSSGFYLFFYTLFASLPLLILIIYLYLNFNFLFLGFFYSINFNFIIHFVMVFSFLVKFPMFMVHFWLPKAHVQAPVFGSMILAGIMLKLGGYGLIRFMFMFDYFFLIYGYIWYGLSIYGCLIVGMICLIQGDSKCLIAYSSISHMGLCLVGFLSLCKLGILSSYLMMISHGFCSSGLFYVCNVIYLRTLSRSFYINKGLMGFIPGLTLILFLLCLFNMSCPPSVNFLSEVFIMYSIVKYWKMSMFFFFFISFLSSCFSFFLYFYIQHGQFSYFYSFSNVYLVEYLLMFIHIIFIFLFIFVCPFMFF
uniref:NADH dehydrogenase subunit 4 n=1 Tax=Krisna expansiva TaxID=1962555 RepID=UPI002551F9D0|nr:NADH dehydrogenase subunit 4 [Krisna expansiva]WGG89415.1 NADH dehydrogenase subunit 4 [Krisna expansiva]